VDDVTNGLRTSRSTDNQLATRRREVPSEKFVRKQSALNNVSRRTRINANNGRTVNVRNSRVVNKSSVRRPGFRRSNRFGRTRNMREVIDTRGRNAGVTRDTTVGVKINNSLRRNGLNRSRAITRGSVTNFRSRRWD
jgi:hypothetical protein